METLGPISYYLTGIQVMEKSFKEIPFEKQPENTGFNFEVRVEDRVQANSQNILIYVTVNITNKEKDETYAKFFIVYIFQVADFDKFITLEENGAYNIPPQLDGVIRVISVSTTRGIIFSELRGTSLHNAIMPVFNMSDAGVFINSEENK